MNDSGYKGKLLKREACRFDWVQGKTFTEVCRRRPLTNLKKIDPEITEFRNREGDLTGGGFVRGWETLYLASLSVNRWTLCSSSVSLGSNTIRQWKLPSPT